MQEILIKKGFLKWLESLDVAPYPAIFFDIPKSVQYSYIQKWLRDIHGIDLHILRNKPGYNEYKVEIYKVSSSTHDYIHFWIKDGEYIKWFLTYEEALEAGLQEALKLIE